MATPALLTKGLPRYSERGLVDVHGWTNDLKPVRWSVIFPLRGK